MRRAGAGAAEGGEGAAGEPLPELLTWRTPAYLAAQYSTTLAYCLWFRRKVEGLEHLPRSGGVVLASNHQSFLDIPLISSISSRHISFVARDSLARARPLAWLMRRCGAVLVRRDRSDRAALREMVAHLERGDVLSIFPEGTRSPDGRLLPFKQGALLVARMARVPIVPAAIWGTHAAWPRHARFPRPRPIGVRLGPPIDSAAPDALEQARAAIAALLAASPVPPPSDPA